MDKQLEVLEKEKAELVEQSHHFLDLAREKEKDIETRILEILNENIDKYKEALGKEKFSANDIYVFSKHSLCFNNISTRHVVLTSRDGGRCLFCNQYLYY